VPGADGNNQTLTYIADAHRVLSVSSPFGTWTQTLSYKNRGVVTEGGFVQDTEQLIKGLQSAVDVYAPTFNQELSFEYPLHVWTNYSVYDNGITIDAELTHAFRFSDSGRPDVSSFSLVSGPASLVSLLEGPIARYSSIVNDSYNFGTTREEYSALGYGTKYSRKVAGVNGTVTLDTNPGVVTGGFGGARTSYGHELFSQQQESADDSFGAPMGMIGRGPGNNMKGLLVS
jgi:hypothetical protein